MASEGSEALVLRGVDYSESSRIVTFLTPGRGRMACMAKGIRRARSPLGPVLDTLNRCEIVYYWKDTRDIQPLADASLVSDYRAIKTDLERSSFAAIPCELAGALAPGNSPSEALYAALVAALDRLEAGLGPNARLWCIETVVAALRIAGFAPSLDLCWHTGAAVPAAPGFSYAGGVVASGESFDRRMSAEALALLRGIAAALDSNDDAGMRGYEPSDPVALREAFALIMGFAQRQVDTRLRSLRVAAQLFPE